MNARTGMSITKTIAVILLCGLAAACGRKGGLEDPPGATAPPPPKKVSPQSPDSKPTMDVPPQTNAP